MKKFTYIRHGVVCDRSVTNFRFGWVVWVPEQADAAQTTSF